MMILRAGVGVAFSALLVLLGCDAFGLSGIDDRRAADRHEQMHPFEADRGVMYNPKPTVTGVGRVGIPTE